MPRRSRSTSQMSEEEKKIRRREQKKLSIRRARAKMSQADLEERRKKDKERYNKKKEQGLIKTIKDFTPRKQRQMRKLWREKAKKKREKEKNNKITQDLAEMNTSSSTPTRSRAHSGRAIAKRNRRLLKTENIYLKKRIRELETKLSKYRMRSVRKSQLKERETRTISKKHTTKSAQKTRKAVHDFLLEDQNSRSTSGKKDTITRGKIKKQIRFLNDSLLNLHKTFVKKTGMQISYETFRRYRPFWVMFPKVEARNTCLCIIHSNTNFLVQALHHAKIIPFISATDLIKSLCCNNILSVPCLERTCLTCKEKEIISNYFDDDDTVTYERWITKDVTVVIKSTSKQCKKTTKEKVRTTKICLFKKLNSALPVFMKHVATMIHQMKTIQYLKEHISPEVGILHVDFSENYNCKYSEEVQSAHFGGSKPQISLHTSVYYSTQSESPDNFIKTTCFCTASENLRHDPVLICVHIQALTARIKELSPNLKHLHILSDGPSTQYRNKSMFNLIATYISKEFGIHTITWHYSERGHGKGAPDGVGGCIKRICDAYVARGKDVQNLEGLMSCLSTNSKRIEVYRIDEFLIPEIQQILDNCILRPFKGTREIHQIAWSVMEPTVLQARRLSCLICDTHVKCPHYELGQINICYKPDIPSTVEAPNTPETRNSPEAPVPEQPATPDASTVSVSPGLSDRLTPEEITDAFTQDIRPTKRARLIIESEDSESSLENFLPKKRRIPKWDDSDDEAIF